MTLQEIKNGLNFTMKADETFRKTGDDGCWKYIAETYKKSAEELLKIAEKHQPNPDLSYTRLYKLCNKYDWFVHGDVTQYNAMFEARDNGATTHDLAIMIWICSDRDKWSVESIQKILDEKLYCASLHGAVHFVSSYEEVRKFIESDDNPDWEINEYSGRIARED